jgi:hypothetical protein
MKKAIPFKQIIVFEMVRKKSFRYFLGASLARVVLAESAVYWQVVFRRMRRPKQRQLERSRQKRSSLPVSDLRSRLLDVILIGRTLRANVIFFRESGDKYKRHSNPAISAVASTLYRDCGKALRLLDYFLAGLELRLQLRKFWRRDHSDLGNFWKLNFDSIYCELEEAAKRLTLLSQPELYEKTVKSLAAQRPRLDLPNTPEEKARASLQRFKGMLSKLKPMDHASLVNSSLRESRMGRQLAVQARRSFAANSRLIRAYARHATKPLPKAERAMEIAEIERLLQRSGYGGT